jgi:hypothetical protein
MRRKDQVSKNIDLAGRFLEHLLENPSELADIRDGENVVVLPGDDPALEKANLEMAKEMAKESLVEHHKHHSRRGRERPARPSITLVP